MSIRRASWSWVVTVLACITACPAGASTWNYLRVGNAEMRFFFDADTVEKTKDTVTVWVKMVQVEAPDIDGSWATAARWRIHCGRRSIQSMATSVYTAEGTFIRSAPAALSENRVAPDTTGEAVIKIACKTGFPRDTSGAEYFKLEDNDVFRATRSYKEMQRSEVDTAPK